MSSAKSEWGTPLWLFNFVQGSDPFTLDVCATRDNTKVVDHYFSPEQDALKQTWTGRWWCNPPYGRKLLAFAKHGVAQCKAGSTGTWLVPSRTDTKWFSILFAQASTVLLVKGRVKFLLPDGSEADAAPFPSAIIETVPNPPARPVVALISVRGLVGK